MICQMVLCLPQPSAASTTFFDAASSRSPVMDNSRATINTAIHGAIQPSPTNAMKAEQVRILSASGSINLPKLVIKLCRRA